MSYVSKDSNVQAVQLAVQTLNVRLIDTQIVSVSGNIATIDVGQPISTVVNALFVDDLAGTVTPIAAASRTVSGETVALNLGVAMTSADSIQLNYIIAE